MVRYELNPEVDSRALNALFADAWPDHTPRDFARLLSQNLGHVCAMVGDALVGFVNVAWDGDRHAFLLDPTVRSDFQRQGIGAELVRRAIDLARAGGVEWLHVDFEPHLSVFYRKCGFRPTEAGLVDLKAPGCD
jgi:GNAT superfamily N-acetyltransferase